MARKMTEWPSKRGPITKIMPSDGCIGDTVPLAVGKWYEFHEFGWYMGNVGWTFLETLSPETEVIDFWHACEHLQTASDHAVAPGWFEKYREILRHDPRGVAKVIRALRHLRDAAAAPDRAETERELAFFRKHRHRMRYHALKEEGIAIGSGVVEAANKTLVTQRMKRSGMRWRIVGGQAVLTFRALIKSGRFERAWKALISATDTPANDNISPRAAAMAIAA